MKQVVLVGGGGHAKVVFDTADRAGLKVEGFLDDRADAPLRELDVPQLGAIRAWRECGPEVRFMPAIGDNATRCALLLGMLDGRDPECLATVIHPSAIISRHGVSIGPGVFIGPGAIVNPGATIGTGVIINSGAIVEHDSVVGDWSHIAPGAALCGAVRTGVRVLVGLGSRILPGRNIGDGAVVGAGAVVTRDVPDQTTVCGNPAREG